MEKIILHCDLNNFYASVECALNPALKNFPLAVSGNPKKRNGIILTKNYIAKGFGVKTGEPIWEAKQKCPSLICVLPHMALYEEISNKVKEIYKQYTDKIEPFGIDECWLDVTKTAHLFGSGEQIALDIRQKIKKQFNITASVGVSFCKLFAKLGSDLKKPDATTVISRENYRKIVYPLQVSDIIGVGRRTEAKLKAMNINTLGDLAYADTRVLKQNFGVVGVDLQQKLLGNDFSEVEYLDNLPDVKSVGNGTTLLQDISTKKEIEQTVLVICDKIASRLRKFNKCGNVISVSIKNNELISVHHEKKFLETTDDSKTIFYRAMKVINDMWDYKQKIRAIRVCVSCLENSFLLKQSSIFNEHPEKATHLNNGIDNIRKKYGNNAITFALVLNNKIINSEFFE